MYRWVLLLGMAFGVLFIPLPVFAFQPAERTFHIDASRFEYNPSVIKVNPGDKVTIELEATDVVHGLAIDGYNLQTSADPGQPASLTFIANRQGLYRFHCTVTCGNMHPFMTGKLVVGQNSFFWRALALVGLAIAAAAWMGRR
jgi:heme/copper-type cytochrome/quinol oxidase subunit 2